MFSKFHYRKHKYILKDFELLNFQGYLLKVSMTEFEPKDSQGNTFLRLSRKASGEKYRGFCRTISKEGKNWAFGEINGGPQLHKFMPIWTKE